MQLELRPQDQDGSISSSFASCSLTKAPKTARITTLYNILGLLALKKQTLVIDDGSYPAANNTKIFVLCTYMFKLSTLLRFNA